MQPPTPLASYRWWRITCSDKKGPLTMPHTAVMNSRHLGLVPQAHACTRHSSFPLTLVRTMLVPSTRVLHSGTGSSRKCHPSAILALETAVPVPPRKFGIGSSPTCTSYRTLSTGWQISTVGRMGGGIPRRWRDCGRIGSWRSSIRVRATEHGCTSHAIRFCWKSLSR